MNRALVLVATPLLAAPVVTVFLLVGGPAERPGHPVADTPVSASVHDTGCQPKAACPQGFARPLEC